MKICKKMLRGVMIMAVAANLVSCVPTRQENENGICEKLEEKYGQTFEIAQYYGLDRMKDTIYVLAYQTDQPEILFEADMARDGSVLNDTYVASCVYRKIEQKMEENIQDIPGYMVLKVRSGSKAMNATDYDMSIETFCSLKEESRFAVYLFFASDEMKTERLYGALERLPAGLPSLSGNVQLFVVDEERLKDIQNYWEENEGFSYDLEKILGDTPNIEIPFEKEQIDMSYSEFERQVGGVQ